jgi:hypothetical protein
MLRGLRQGALIVAVQSMGCGLIVGFTDLTLPDAGKQAPRDGGHADASVDAPRDVKERRDVAMDAALDARPDAVDAGRDTSVGNCLGALCSTVTVLWSADAEAKGIALDDTSVYWTAGSGGNFAILKTSLDGGSVTTIASDQSGVETEHGIGELGVDSTNVYWATVTGVNAAAKTGGGMVMTLTFGSSQTAEGLAVSDSGVVLLTTNAVNLATLSGGEREIFDASTGFSPYVTPDRIFWLTEQNGTAVSFVGFDGGGQGASGTLPNGSAGLAVANGFAYVVGPPLLRVALEGGVTTSLSTVHSAASGPLAVDVVRVYWAEGDTLFGRSFADGGVGEALWAGLDGGLGTAVEGLGLHGAYIYWARGNSVYRAAKP